MKKAKKYVMLALALGLSCNILMMSSSKEVKAAALEEEAVLEELDTASPEVIEAEEGSSNPGGWANLIQGQFGVTYHYTTRNITTYKLDLPSSGMVTQTMEVMEAKTSVRIFDSNENKLISKEYNRGNSYTDTFYLVGGTYYFQLYNWFYDGDQNTDITWFFEASGESFNETQDNRNDNRSTAFPISVGQEIIGQFAENDTDDYYTFSCKAGAITLRVNNKTDKISVNVKREDGKVDLSQEISRGVDEIPLKNIPAGKYYIWCSKKDGVGKYSFTATFKEEPKKPAKPSLKKVENKSGKKLKASWNKAKVSGYEIQIAKDKKFKSGKKSKTLSKSKSSYTFTGLSKNKKYYCRIRAYNSASGMKKYSNWSKVKSVKIKK